MYCTTVTCAANSGKRLPRHCRRCCHHPRLAVVVDIDSCQLCWATICRHCAHHLPRYKAIKAGKYQLAVMGADDGDMLPGSPFAIDITVRCSRRRFPLLALGCTSVRATWRLSAVLSQAQTGESRFVTFAGGDGHSSADGGGPAGLRDWLRGGGAASDAGLSAARLVKQCGMHAAHGCRQHLTLVKQKRRALLQY